jgi:tetratricopeptide (TPR) repeat protein
MVTAVVALVLLLSEPEETAVTVEELIELAESLARQGDHGSAERMAITALEREPRNARALALLDELSDVRASVEEAERLAREEELLAQDARMSELEEALARSNLRLNRQLAGITQELRALRDTRTAVGGGGQPVTQGILQLGQEERARLIDAGIREYEAGEYNRAQATLRQLLLADPNDGSAKAYLGASIFDQSPTEPEPRAQALRLASEATEDESVAPFAYVTLGRIYEQEGLPEQAEQAYVAAIERAPNSAEANQSLARLLARQGRIDEAARYSNRVLATDPDDRDARFTLLATSVGNESWEDALEHASVLIENDNASAAVYDYQARALGGTGDCGGAIESWQRAYDLRPGWEYQRSMARCYRQIGRTTAALQSFARAAEANPRNTPEARESAYDVLREAAALFTGDTRPELRVAFFADAVELLPQDARLLEELAQSYIEAGQRRRARDTYEELLELDPTFPGAHLSLARLYVDLEETEPLRDLRRSARTHRPGTDELQELERLMDEVF